jgi:hypothetical protein
MKSVFKQKWFKIFIAAAVCVIAVYTLVYVDVILRARSAYLEGEKYFSWYENPKLKEAALVEWHAKEKRKIENLMAKNKIDKTEYDRQSEILDFTYGEKLRESSIKYAYIWYQTVIELFSPPESKWVKLAREKMPKAKELWKQELKAKNIPFEDYMLE